MIKYCALAALLVGACLQFSCAARKQLISPPEVTVSEVETIDDAVRLLRKNYEGIDYINADGEITMQFPDEGGLKKAVFVLLIKRPDKLRMRAYRRPLPTIFELVSDGQECWVYVPSRKTAYLNKGCRPFLVGEEKVAVSTKTIVTAILVVADFGVLSSSPMALEKENNLSKLRIFDKARGRREIWINTDNGLVERQLIVGDNEALETEIVYKEHAIDGDSVVPVEIDIVLPQVNARISLSVKSLRSSSQIPANAFKFAPPAGTDTDILGTAREDSF